MGLLSLLPAMLRLPMAEVAPALPLRDEIRQALQGTVITERSLLAWFEFHERGDWAEADAVAQAYGLNQEQLLTSAAAALLWAEDALKFAS